MTSKKTAVSARQRAHQALATSRQRRIAREMANETDLAAYLVLEQQIADAEHTYRDAVAALRHRQAVHLRQWRDRGDKLTDIAELTGKSVAELGRLMKSAAEPAKPSDVVRPAVQPE